MITNDSDANDSGNLSRGALDACRREIEALHQFFEGWLSGERSNTDASFRRLDRALAPDFQLIHPSGDGRSRDDILTGLRAAHGSQPGLTIEIRNVQLRGTGERLLAATYEEWQRSADTEDGRLSTVVFARRSEAPNGLRWRHVHETWLQAPAEA
jgi:hypothetical protein